MQTLTASRAALFAALLLAGCAAPPLNSQTAAELGYQVLGPNMQYDDQLLMAWIPGAAAQQADARATLTAELARVIAQGARQPVHVTVAGDNSAFAAQIIHAACGLIAPELPRLNLVFVGDAADAPLARAAVLSRRGSFYFEPAPR